MKRNLLFAFSSMLITLAFFSCQKETSPVSKETATAASANLGSCRMASYHYYDPVADLNNYDFYSYANGKVDEWITSYGIRYKMEYGTNGKLAKSKAYDGGIHLYTINFIYKNNKVIKEIWYNGNSTDVFDEVVYTYNSKGQMINGEGLLTGYNTTNTYTPEGNLESWNLYVGGVLLISAHYTYKVHYSNPNNASPGIEYSFAYANAAFGTGHWWYSSEKVVFYDENGIPSVYYDLDPGLTQWQIGQQNFPVHVEYSDLLFGIVTTSFTFENCGGQETASKAQISNLRINSERDKTLRSILSGPKGEIKGKLTEFIGRAKKKAFLNN